MLELWRGLLHVPNGFTEPGITVVSDDRTGVAPLGWCGVVAIGDSAVVTTPTETPVAIGNLMSADLDPDQLTDPAQVVALVGPLRATLGPADLQYGAERPSGLADASGPHRFDDALVQRALASLSAVDRSEAGIDDSLEAVFVALDGDAPVALAGFRRWEGIAAHIGVATTPSSRRQGHGRRAAATAMNHALDSGLLVQWRSHRDNSASRLLGCGLGLVHCGRQFSFEVGPADRPAESTVR